jgi:hypothetical protein
VPLAAKAEPPFAARISRNHLLDDDFMFPVIAEVYT